jgi:hypothetical protein
LWRDVSYRDVLRFIEKYRFHELSEDARPELIKRYIEKRNLKGALQHWDVAVIGNSRKEAEKWKLPDGTLFGLNRRSRINDQADPTADIKTLSAPRDLAINLKVPDGIDVTKRSEIDRLRRQQRPDVGLLLLYPIDPVSASDKQKGRSPLNAPYDNVMGAAFIFPTPSAEDSEVEHQYVSADLSGIYVEEEDPAILQQDDEDDPG